MSERTPWTFLGKIIGTATGWDGDDGHLGEFVLYEFEPSEGIALSKGDLTIDVTKGEFTYYDNDGNLLETFSILETLSATTA